MPKILFLNGEVCRDLSRQDAVEVGGMTIVKASDGAVTIAPGDRVLVTNRVSSSMAVCSLRDLIEEAESATVEAAGRGKVTLTNGRSVPTSRVVGVIRVTRLTSEIDRQVSADREAAARL